MKETWFQLDQMRTFSAGNTVNKAKDYEEIESKFVNNLTEVNSIIRFYLIKGEDLEMIA